MRIVIDMQGAQTESRFRGIGRYTLSFAQAIVRNRGEHDVFLALSGLFPDTIEPIRAAFDGFLPQENIRVWYAPGPVAEEHPDNDARREVAELIREAFLASLQPDVIHISSLFEGYVDDAVTSIGRFDKTTPVCVTLQDLVPQQSFDQRLESDHQFASYYQSKFAYIKQAAVLLAITESVAQKSINMLDIDTSKVVKLAEASGEQLSQFFDLSCTDENDENNIDLVLPAADSVYWREIAGIVLNAFENLVDCEREFLLRRHGKQQRPRLAFVSPLPPERTGIADYSAELLPALAEHYDIELVVAQNKVDDPWINSHGKLRDVAWLRKHVGEIDRVLYHVGNSPYHAYMLPLIEEIPGVVVLHDFFLGHFFQWIESHVAANAWTKALYLSHGYRAILKSIENPETAVFDFPANLDFLRYAQGVIVHSEHSRNLARQWYGNNCAEKWALIPLLRNPATMLNKATARKQLGIGENDFVVCSFGFLGATKLNHRLLQAYLDSAMASDKQCHLIYVGETPANDYGSSLLNTIRSSNCTDRIRITGFASPEMFKQYLVAADLAVQLRTLSRGESSAAVLDCMNYALPLIVNANGTMAELNHDAVWMLPDEFDDAILIEALETLWREPERRCALGERGQDIIHSRHAPVECAKYYADAIERFHHHAAIGTSSLIKAIARQKKDSIADTALIQLAKQISATMPLQSPAKRLFLDVTATCDHDLKTGIERVARGLMLALFDAMPAGFRVEPVYLSNIEGAWHYRYAHHYMLSLLGCPSDALGEDDCVEPECGDILLGLDLSGNKLVQAQQSGLVMDYRNQGVAVYFIVFDLLPVRLPEAFPSGADLSHGQWLRTVSTCDGAICISKAVADDLAAWQTEVGLDLKDRRSFQIDWFHLGADVAGSVPSRGMPDNAEWTLRQIKARPSFLMVGTIEPRKGYLQAIEAFNQLWNEGVDVNLVIVGKEGWQGLPDDMRCNIPETINMLRNHPELNKRLFWLEGISDEYLEKIYAASTCLIAASYGEGFGLPLIEAAQHKLPIIARDIPVFREVAGEHAYYFAGKEPEAIATAVSTWLDLYQNQQHPKSDVMPWLTWQQSAIQLLEKINPLIAEVNTT